MRPTLWVKSRATSPANVRLFVNLAVRLGLPRAERSGDLFYPLYILRRDKIGLSRIGVCDVSHTTL